MDWTGGFTSGFTVKLVGLKIGKRLEGKYLTEGEGGGRNVWMRGTRCSTRWHLSFPLGTRLYAGKNFKKGSNYGYKMVKRANNIPLPLGTRPQACKVDFSSFIMIFLICTYKLKQKVNIHILRLPAESLKICCKLSGNTHRRTLLHLTNLWTNRSMVSRVQTGKVSPVIFSFKMVVCWGRGEVGFYYMSNDNFKGLMQLFQERHSCSRL